METIKWHLLILLCLISDVHLWAQFGQSGTTRAVVIGISDYQDNNIPDLQFAHRDAEAFAEYLLKVYPGKIEPGAIQLLINDRATGGMVHQALNRLLEESTRMDKIMIFFSGHGDVETIDDQDLGHLLLYDTPASTYQINSLRLSDLKEVIHKLSVDIGAEVNLFTDACRSGNLAGALVNGAQATAAALTTQFANEIKILSCQPNEYSLEGLKWGGGRGVFSYHLIEGLTGLADQNNDMQVTLREIQRYLEDRVEEDAAPSSQSPMVIGNKSKVVALVNEEDLVRLVLRKTNQPDASDDVISSIYQKSIQANRPEVEALTDDFYTALQYKCFLPKDESNGDQPLIIQSASVLYDRLASLNIPQIQLRGLRGDYIAALQDDAQTVINAYLKSDNREIDERDLGLNEKYSKFPSYLKKAAELLGTNHYLYSQLLAKQYYFEAVNYRLLGITKESGNESFERAEEMIQKALIYDEKAAYLYLELGLIYSVLDDSKSIPMNLKAIEFSPSWVLPYANIAYRYYVQEEYDKAEEYANKAIRINPRYKKSYWTRSAIYNATGRGHLAEQELLALLERNGPDLYIYLQLGEYYYGKDDFETAKKYFLLSNGITENFSSHSVLGLIYYGINDSLAYDHWQKALVLRPNSPEMMNNLAWMHQLRHEYDKAIDYYFQTIEVAPKLLNAQLNLGKIYFILENYQNAQDHFEIVVDEIDPAHTESYYFLTKIYALLLDYEAANKALKNAIENGLETIDELYTNAVFEEFRKTKDFKSVTSTLKN